MKKIMAVLVSVMTGLCVFASCGNSNSSDSGDISSKKVTETTSNDDVSSDDKLLSDDNNEDTQTSTTTTTEAVTESVEPETSSFAIGFNNMFGESKRLAESWFRYNIATLSGTNGYSTLYTNVDTVVYQSYNNDLKLLGINWGWAEISTQSTDDYAFSIAFYFSSFDYDRYEKYNTGAHDKKAEEVNLAYKTLYDKLVAAYGEPTTTYEDSWCKYDCSWENTSDGDIYVYDDTHDEDGSGELGLIFTVSGFDYSTRIER